MKMIKGKKMKNLKQKIGIRIVLTGVGLGSLLGGCESDYQSTDLAIGSAAAQYSATHDPSLSPKDAAALGAVGGLLGILSQQQAAREAAREGKTQLTVNVYEGVSTEKEWYSDPYYSEREGLYFIFPPIDDPKYPNILSFSTADLYYPKEGFVWKYPYSPVNFDVVPKDEKTKEIENKYKAGTNPNFLVRNNPTLDELIRRGRVVEGNPKLYDRFKRLRASNKMKVF